jgi:hypothetical protein
LGGAVSERITPIKELLDTTEMEVLQGYVQAFVAKASEVDLNRWLRSVHHTMDRAGLLLCGDVATASRMLKQQLPDPATHADRIRTLTHFVVSEEHFNLRAHLGTALVSA